MWSVAVAAAIGVIALVVVAVSIVRLIVED